MARNAPVKSVVRTGSKMALDLNTFQIMDSALFKAAFEQSTVQRHALAWTILRKEFLLVVALYCYANHIKGLFREQGCQIFLGPNIPKWEKYTK
jgi:hypothetical protein